MFVTAYENTFILIKYQQLAINNDIVYHHSVVIARATRQLLRMYT